jgi:hypothetical protein
LDRLRWIVENDRLKNMEPTSRIADWLGRRRWNENGRPKNTEWTPRIAD